MTKKGTTAGTALIPPTQSDADKAAAAKAGQAPAEPDFSTMTPGELQGRPVSDHAKMRPEQRTIAEKAQERRAKADAEQALKAGPEPSAGAVKKPGSK